MGKKLFNGSFESDKKLLRNLFVCALDFTICVLDIVNGALRLSSGSKLSGAGWLLMGLFFALVFVSQTVALARPGEKGNGENKDTRQEAE